MSKYILSLMFLSLSAQAEISGPWDVKSVEIHKISSAQMTAQVTTPTEDGCAQQTVSPQFIDPSDFNTILTIGQKIWTIIEANKPVVTVEQAPTLAALPKTAGCWTALANWQVPKTETYQVVYKNFFDMEVVSFQFRLQYNYGGSLNGHGKYLANVTVLPEQLNVLWGYTFNANVAADQAVNLGTTADPVAGLGMTLNWQVKTVLKESDNSFHFFVQGDGVAEPAP